MPILLSEIKFYLSGGASNADISAALGGVISSNIVSITSLHNLFTAVTPGEALAGDVEYRCIYVRNTNVSLTMSSVMAWINSNTPNTQSTLDIGLGTSVISATEQTVSDASSAPGAVTFSAPTSKEAGLVIGDLVTDATKAIWLRRTISVAAVAYSGDQASLSIGGGTPA